MIISSLHIFFRVSQGYFVFFTRRNHGQKRASTYLARRRSPRRPRRVPRASPPRKRRRPPPPPTRTRRPRQRPRQRRSSLPDLFPSRSASAYFTLAHGSSVPQHRRIQAGSARAARGTRGRREWERWRKGGVRASGRHRR
jgi:hypothetical protein